MYDIISLFAAELEEPKNGIWGKGLMLFFISESTQVFIQVMDRDIWVEILFPRQ